MTATDIYPALTEIFNEVFGRRDIVLRPDLTGPDIPGWNSFKFIDLIMAAETRFGVQLNTEDIDRINTVGDLAALIVAKG